MEVFHNYWHYNRNKYEISDKRKKKRNVHSKAIAGFMKQRNYLKYKLQVGLLDRNNYNMK